MAVIKANEKYIWDRLKEIGFNDIQTAAIMGNLSWESGGNQYGDTIILDGLLIDGRKATQADMERVTREVQNGTVKTGSIAYGMCQWRGSRLKALSNYVKSNNLDVLTTEAQIDFVIEELKNQYKSAATAVKNSNTIEAAVRAWESKYEVAGGANISNRIQLANKFLERYGGSSVTTNPGISSGNSEKEKDIAAAMREAASHYKLEIEQHNMWFWIKGQYSPVEEAVIQNANTSNDGCDTPASESPNNGNSPTSQPTQPTNQTCEVGVMNDSDIAKQEIPSSMNFLPQGGAYTLSELIKPLTNNGKTYATKDQQWQAAVQYTEEAHRAGKTGPIDHLIFLSQQLKNFFDIMQWSPADVTLNSGYRNERDNKRAGFTTPSDHTRGFAIDLVYKNRKHYPEVVKMADLVGQGRICSSQILWEVDTSGIKQGIIHLALRPKNSSVGNKGGLMITGPSGTGTKVRNITSGTQVEEWARANGYLI